ncbi:hypothetical protein [Streptomyces sp. NPDC059881]|uniref:hypothetical protein n=1 Tax=Streptomyces sp. NPDC059881 TaxID=3346986 RepID=UPI003660AAE2
MTNRKILVTAVLCATAAVGLTACGGEKDKGGADKPASSAPSPKAPVDPFAGLTADQIADKSLDITKAADSVKVKGLDSSDKDPMEFDLAISEKGDCGGTMGSKGAKAEMRKVGGPMYMKGDDKFWEQSLKEDGSSAEEIAAVKELFKGRWIKIPAEEVDKEEMGALCDFDALLEPADSAKTGLTKGADADVDGKKAVVLTKKDGAETITFYVAKEGEPYLLKFTSEGGKEPKSAAFSDFNAPITVTVPPADQVVDPSKLGG